MAQLAVKGFNVASMTLPAASQPARCGLVGQPYIVKFNLQSDKPRQQAGTFLATIAQLQKSKTSRQPSTSTSGSTVGRIISSPLCCPTSSEFVQYSNPAHI